MHLAGWAAPFTAPGGFRRGGPHGCRASVPAPHHASNQNRMAHASMRVSPEQRSGPARVQPAHFTSNQAGQPPPNAAGPQPGPQGASNSSFTGGMANNTVANGRPADSSAQGSTYANGWGAYDYGMSPDTYTEIDPDDYYLGDWGEPILITDWGEEPPRRSPPPPPPPPPPGSYPLGASPPSLGWSQAAYSGQSDGMGGSAFSGAMPGGNGPRQADNNPGAGVQ